MRNDFLGASGGAESTKRREPATPSATSRPVSSLLAAMAHRMSQPLTAVRGRLELVLLKGRNLSDYRLATEKALAAAEELATIVQSVGELAEAYSPSGKVGPADLCVLARQVVEDLTPIAQSRQVTLTLNDPPRMNVISDGEMLYQGLLKIVQFAILRSPARGRVAVLPSPSAEDASLSIEDEGRHIPEAILRVLFEDVSLDSLHQESVPNQYWNLFVAQQMIAAAGGSLAAGNIATRGCRYCIRLPLDPG